MRTLARRLGTTLAVLGVLLVVYAAMVVFWRDPVTSIYTAYEQHEMRGELSSTFSTWQGEVKQQLGGTTVEPAGTHGGATITPTVASSAAVLRSVHKVALRYAAAERGHTGRPIGRIQIKRIGLSTVVVENTDYWGSLSKGPGRYEQGSFPGLGKTTGIAGHRTTWAAPFRHIDSVRNGDSIVVTMPYATFTYRVLRHKIVDNGDWSIMNKVGFDELVLSACHPLYSASHRYVVFARLVNVKIAGAERGVNLPAASTISAA
jgi:sortase A